MPIRRFPPSCPGLNAWVVGLNGLCTVVLTTAGFDPLTCPGPELVACALGCGFLELGNRAPALVDGRGDGRGGGRPEPALVEGRGDGRG